ncbi:hypothetical protein BALCAV_0208140 [Alkalihalobacillus alcalophilus ATCC 27647 = CGMCC 1.3604]|uniref:Uncharacterized protein n=1 Tax=Alkalihalobacillus alcalophilus ATCC 27647 = CGMCC 1.3604 TaxID=1218173 RepID=A0A094XGA7_ALKAL|nr:hypothetical protein BALCAV_0208140 [Alkalihalobacillus alcalophilus ATCC 27647 = CGMCC 1.3604]
MINYGFDWFFFDQNGTSGMPGDSCGTSEERETPQALSEEAPDSPAERVGHAASGVKQNDKPYSNVRTFSVPSRTRSMIFGSDE